MNPRYMRVRPDMTVAEALGYFRRQAQQRAARDIPTYAYILDSQGKLSGQITLTDLIAGDPAANVGHLMHTNIITIPEEAVQEKVASILSDTGPSDVPV